MVSFHSIFSIKRNSIVAQKALKFHQLDLKNKIKTTQ